MINSLQDKIPNAPHFTWHEALWLRDWNIHVFPSVQEHRNIVKIAQKLEHIRAFFGNMIFVTSWLRPESYNKMIGGSINSAHINGLAVDFVVDKLSCDFVRLRLKDHLEDLEIRMEDHKGDWIHIDLKPPGPAGRFFKP